MKIKIEDNYKKDLEPSRRIRSLGYWFNDKNQKFERPSRNKQATLVQDPKGIKISIFERETQQTAEVIIHYIDLLTSQTSEFKRVIFGKHTQVLQEALKILNKNNIKEFIENWDRTIYHLYNKSLKSIDNVPFKTEKENINFGPYNIISAGELLKKKIAESDTIENVEQLASLTGINAATIYRHIDGSDIGREQALKYAKALGVDPADLLFNPIYVSVWGTVNNVNGIFFGSKDEISFEPGEISSWLKNDLVLCPREIYRPDVKAINLQYEDTTAFYYSSIQQGVKDGELVVIGADFKNFNRIDTKYYFGYLERNKTNPSLVSIKNYNVNSSILSEADIKLLERDVDEDFHTFQDYANYQNNLAYVIKDVKPNFISPVITVTNSKRLNASSHIKTKQLKNYRAVAALEQKREDFLKLQFQKDITKIQQDYYKKHNLFYKQLDELNRKIEELKLQTSKNDQSKIDPKVDDYFINKFYNKLDDTNRFRDVKSYNIERDLRLLNILTGRAEIEKAKNNENLTFYQIGKLIEKYTLDNPFLVQWLAQDEVANKILTDEELSLVKSKAKAISIEDFITKETKDKREDLIIKVTEDKKRA